MIPRGRPKKFENLDDLLTVQEAAAFLKVSPSTVRRLVAAGEIPKVNGIGRAIRIRRAVRLRVLVEPFCTAGVVRCEQDDLATCGSRNLALDELPVWKLVPVAA